MTKTNTTRLVKTALLIALATILSMFKVFEFPFGGGVTIVSMLPIVLISYIYGVKWGLFSAFVGAVLQMMLGFKTISAMFLPGDEQMLVWQAILICVIDYIIAYTLLGFGGIFRNKLAPSKALAFGSVVALTLRLIAHIISGYIFYGAWAEWFFGELGKIGEAVLENISGNALSLLYSTCYNGAYMVLEIIFTFIVALIIAEIPQLCKKEDCKKEVSQKQEIKEESKN